MRRDAKGARAFALRFELCFCVAYALIKRWVLANGNWPADSIEYAALVEAYRPLEMPSDYFPKAVHDSRETYL
jgi:hypothetical protein